MTDEDDTNLEFGFHHQFGDWSEAHLNSLRNDQPENIIQHISSIKTAHQIEQNDKNTPNDSDPTIKNTILHVEDAIPTEDSSFLRDHQQSIPSQVQGSMDTAYGIFFSSKDFEYLLDQEIAQKEKQDYEQFNLESVAAIDDIDVDLLARNFFEENKKSDKNFKRNTKGPKRQNLEDYPVEKRANIIKCREYRKKKKDEQLQDENEMKALEIKNIELRNKEEKMRDLVLRGQRLYIKLVREGKIKV